MVKVISSLLLLTAIAIGCSDSNTATNSSGTDVTGDLAGKVRSYNYLGRFNTDNSGILVQCEGTPYSTLSDSAGNWIIHNLPTRTYSISFSKPDFYTWKTTSYTFVGGGIVRYKDANGKDYAQIGELPRFKLFLDGITMPHGNVYGNIYAHTSNDAPDSVSLGLYILVGTNPNLNINDKSSYTILQPYYPFNSVAQIDTNMSITLPFTTAFFKGYTSGVTLYFKLYPSITSDSYYDARTDTYIPVGYSTEGSNVLSAVMP